MNNQTQEITKPIYTGAATIDPSIGTIIPAPMLEILLDRAARQPRNEQLALESALNELRMVPQLAAKAYYSIPYNDNDTGKKTPVEGLTIGSAMAMTRRWGNIITGGILIAEDEKGWDLMGICLDLESVTYNARPYRSSKFYKPKGSQSMVPLIGQQKENKLLSGISKAIRTSALWTIPAWYRESYFAEAKQLVLSPAKQGNEPQKTVAERIADARAVFGKKWLVTEKEMNDYLSGLTFENEGEILQHLRGLYNGIEEGHTTVEMAFGREKAQPGMPQEKKS